MSWTFIKTKHNTELMDLLTGAILQAHHQNIIMLNSSRDAGMFSPIATLQVYPYALSHLGIIRIGSALVNGHGTHARLIASEWSCPFDYVLPSEPVVFDRNLQPSAALTDGTMLGLSYTGSSYATALAAGVAALLLICAGTDMHGRYTDRKQWRTAQNMRTAFNMMAEQSGRERIVDPWSCYFKWNVQSVEELSQAVARLY